MKDNRVEWMTDKDYAGMCRCSIVEASVEIIAITNSAFRVLMCPWAQRHQKISGRVVR